MQHLLDFVHEHTLDEQLYLVVRSRAGELELRWQRAHNPDCWEVRKKRSLINGPWESISRSELLTKLEARGTAMEQLESELRAVAVTQIVFADMVLCDARKALGRDLVRKAVLSHRDFVGELRSALSKWTTDVQVEVQPRPSVSLIKGGGASTEARRGHLSLVPSAV